VKEIFIRLAVGGSVVSVFAILGDILKPKTFAGLFSAAPSVALATLALTIVDSGKPYAAMEARAMMIGAVAFLVYAWCVSRLLMKHKIPTLAVTSGSLAVWMIAAFGLHFAFIK
jgi:uncharacterized membrane protein (GlpM family)